VILQLYILSYYKYGVDISFNVKILLPLKIEMPRVPGEFISRYEATSSQR